jgi:FixJ family two-component response regulator
MAKTQMKPKLLSTMVCEGDGQWAAALRREMPGAPLLETRALGDLLQRLPACLAAVVILELTSENKSQLLAAILQIARQFPQVMPIVMAKRQLSAWEDACREAGAIHFVASPRRVAEVTEIVQRRAANLRQSDADDTDEHQSIEDRILATLPWGQ